MSRYQQEDGKRERQYDDEVKKQTNRMIEKHSVVTEEMIDEAVKLDPDWDRRTRREFIRKALSKAVDYGSLRVVYTKGSGGDGGQRGQPLPDKTALAPRRPGGTAEPSSFRQPLSSASRNREKPRQAAKPTRTPATTASDDPMRGRNKTRGGDASREPRSASRERRKPSEPEKAKPRDKLQPRSARNRQTAPVPDQSKPSKGDPTSQSQQAKPIRSGSEGEGDCCQCPKKTRCGCFKCNKPKRDIHFPLEKLEEMLAKKEGTAAAN